MMTDDATCPHSADERTRFDLTCPMCGGAMNHEHRADNCVDECEDCKGVFLSRDALMGLIAGEAAHYSRPHEQILEAERMKSRRSYDTELPFLGGLMGLPSDI